VGLLVAPWAWKHVAPMPPSSVDVSWPVLVLAGLLVGVGSRMGNGCTSGHGICGLSRLSPRSLLATLTFMGCGFLVVYLVRHWI
ncbi:MAG: YeeE/YedE family protein, partial [Burkholderiaceae bacterium]|nr:YeeE/YedE family protein [Burkholderiaceae bacterium]